LDDQAQRLWRQLSSLPSDLARNLLLEQVHNRNEVLYFKVLSEHLPELITACSTTTCRAPARW
jgi:malate dehydrogenase (oxaloacetate-decarboxylating)